MAEIIHADCVDAMQAMEPDSVDAIVCDPPYMLGFMGKAWDTLSPGDIQHGHDRWATEALRVLKPGGHLLAFGGTRTYHRLACAVEDAGFEIRDSLIWIYGSGFPKSLDVSKAIDKAAGAEREVTGKSARHIAQGNAAASNLYAQDEWTRENGRMGEFLTAPATPEAQHWQGWGTALKPAHEPIVVARKPLVGTVAANVLEHGTGALNIDGCRVGMSDEDREVVDKRSGAGRDLTADIYAPGLGRDEGERFSSAKGGRWPPNVTLSHLPECKQTGTRKVKAISHNVNRKTTVEPRLYGAGFGKQEAGTVARGFGADGTETIPAYTCAPGCPVAELDRQSGESQSQQVGGRGGRTFHGQEYDESLNPKPCYGDTGGASRFFYVAKASRAERNAGASQNGHPTVKPIALMRWLVRLVTPPGGRVLDPFAGSGSTGVAAVLEGFDFVGIEREAEYVALAEARVAFWAQFPGADVDKVLVSDARAREIEASGQLGLL